MTGTALLGAVVDTLFPPSCGACRALLPRLQLLCADCAAAVETLPAPRCPDCGLPGTPGSCPDCADLERHGGRAFARAQALYVYGGPVEEALLRAKFGGTPHLAQAAGALLADALADGRLQAPDPAVDVVQAIPVGRHRLAERGYDQGALMAARLAAALGLGRPPHWLQRCRETRAQATLGRDERAANVQQAFTTHPAAQLVGRSVLLVDDVLTTGHTASAAARALRAAGARHVEVLSLARAVLHPPL